MLALFGLSVRRLLGGKRLLGILALFLLPSLLTLIIRWQGGAERPEMVEFFTLLNLVPHGALPFAALLLSSGLIQDEVEEQTLTYLLVRPLPRWVIFLTKLLAAVVATTLDRHDMHHHQSLGGLRQRVSPWGTGGSSGAAIGDLRSGGRGLLRFFWTDRLDASQVSAFGSDLHHFH